MSFINYNDKEINFKIVYCGPPLSGKTSSLKHLYQKGDGKDFKKISIETGNERTLFFDFVPLFLSSVQGYKTRFHLYTVPGQTLYDDARKLILKGVDGVIFVADSRLEQMQANLKSLENLKRNLKEEGLEFDQTPVVFQYNKRDLPQVMNLQAMREMLNPGHAPDFESVALEGRGVFEAFKEIAKLVIQNHQRKA